MEKFRVDPKVEQQLQFSKQLQFSRQRHYFWLTLWKGHLIDIVSPSSFVKAPELVPQDKTEGSMCDTLGSCERLPCHMVNYLIINFITFKNKYVCISLSQEVIHGQQRLFITIAS